MFKLRWPKYNIKTSHCHSEFLNLRLVQARPLAEMLVQHCWMQHRLGSSPSQEKSRERRTWDICSISNVTCKTDWRENLLLSTRKPRFRRKNPTVNFGALANVPSLSLLVSPYFSLIFSRLFSPLACITVFNPLKDGLESSLDQTRCNIAGLVRTPCSVMLAYVKNVGSCLTLFKNFHPTFAVWLCFHSSPNFENNGRKVGIRKLDWLLWSDEVYTNVWTY